MAIKLKACKVCKTKFEPIKPLQMVCSPLCAVKYTQEQKLKLWQKEKKDRKKAMLTLSDWHKIAQQVFNAYIRLRDEGLPCISCGITHGKRDAGHYYSVGNYPSVRYNEDNCHSQCVGCNQYKGGNLHQYVIGLEKKIGIERLEELGVKAQKSRRYTIPEVQDLVKEYKERIKKMKKNK